MQKSLHLKIRLCKNLPSYALVVLNQLFLPKDFYSSSHPAPEKPFGVLIHEINKAPFHATLQQNTVGVFD
jgi:hypothetical protein